MGQKTTELETLLLEVARDIDRMEAMVAKMDRPGRSKGGSGVSGAIRRVIARRRQLSVEDLAAPTIS